MTDEMWAQLLAKLNDAKYRHSLTFQLPTYDEMLFEIAEMEAEYWMRSAS